jgi:hypothetical protein
MQQTSNNKNEDLKGDEDLKGGRYARSEDELYKKAIALLEKCEIETQSSAQEMPVLDPDAYHTFRPRS